MPGINSGDVLLSHKLYKHYHRGCSVSLPCSEWERVVPLRYDHQRAKSVWHPRHFDSDSLVICQFIFQKNH